MENLEYWKISLDEALPNITFKDKEIEKIISISNMEFEYCSSESNKKTNISTESKEYTRIKILENNIELLKETICKIKKCDSVTIDNGVVKIYNK
jgi:hypothetical protein